MAIFLLNILKMKSRRLKYKKKIAAIRSMDDYRELIDELIDRFGDIPKEVENLMDISH